MKLEPKELRAASVLWFERQGKLPNDQEVLFFACLVAQQAESVSELLEWCSLVLNRYEAEWKEQQDQEGGGGAGWQVPAEWKRLDSAVMRIINDAYNGKWTADMLSHICTAIKGWRGVKEGQHDELTPGRLKEHRNWAREPKNAKVGVAKARLHAAVIPVARLLKSKDGARLRALLKVDEKTVPTAMEELRATQATKAALFETSLQEKEAELKAQLKAKQKIVDAHRKLKASREKQRKRGGDGCTQSGAAEGG